MSKKKKIVLLIIVLMVISLSFIGGQSYAKYMSKVTGKGTAEIASWSFIVNDKEEKMQTISLTSSINNSNVLNNKIAPGTSNSFQIKLNAENSDVGIDYVVRFENETTKPTNLKFRYNSKTYNTLAELQKDLIGTIRAKEEKILKIEWIWEYETKDANNSTTVGDKVDTQDAKQLSNYSFDIIVSGIQSNPNT